VLRSREKIRGGNARKKKREEAEKREMKPDRNTQGSHPVCSTLMCKKKGGRRKMRRRGKFESPKENGV